MENDSQDQSPKDLFEATQLSARTRIPKLCFHPARHANDKKARQAAEKEGRPKKNSVGARI